MWWHGLCNFFKNQRDTPMLNDSGFSLAELMVVCAIVGVLVLIATPVLVSVLPDYKLKSAADDLSSDLRRARSIAIKLNQSVSVEFDETANAYSVFGKSKPLAGGITFGFPGRSTKVTFPSNKVTFNPRGLIGTATDAKYYAFLQNSKGKGYRVGVKGMAASIVMERCDSLPAADDCTQ
jgi:prepilin-type N-terminal cleavage/methylation domain-containing protein